MFVTENSLDNWVRGHAKIAQGVIVELVCRLIVASCRTPDSFRFPLGDSVGQPGEDGFLDTSVPFAPYIPAGPSYWEIGTGVKPSTKASSDYRERTAAVDLDDRQRATFIFVTPLSGTRAWQQPAQVQWTKRRIKQQEWANIRVMDGTILVAWMRLFPSVERWLAGAMGYNAHKIDTLEQRWTELTRIGHPPPLPATLFLINRDEACGKLTDLFEQRAVRLKVDTRFPRHVADFVAAYVAALPPAQRSSVGGRCVIATDATVWNDLIALRDRHVLVADFDIDDTDSPGMRLLENARNAGHSVIYSGMPGGIPDVGRVSLAQPRTHQVETALRDGGYAQERARNLAQRTGGDLGSLLRCIQGLSLRPEWAENGDAAELAIAALLGSWSESAKGDREIAEDLLGKGYGEWIEAMRNVALRPSAPLVYRDSSWKFVARYEGWYELGPRVFDEHLDRLHLAAVKVFCHRDPQFDLPSSERYSASIRGKSLPHSNLLRTGLGTSLALLGSHPRALTSCTRGKAEATAASVVRKTLTNANWERWAGLADVLPSLAEAAPAEFLRAVEVCLSSEDKPFEGVFAQEGDALLGRNYMTGLLWALETLAWDPANLARVALCLGGLAAKDPGGNWGNRPSNSLTTIFLPWMPQTCAPVSKRKTAVAALVNELPEVGWKLLLSLLPNARSTSFGTARPAWREFIPDDGLKRVTEREYGEEVLGYASLAVKNAKSDCTKVEELVHQIEHLPTAAQNELMTYLASAEFRNLADTDRLGPWTALTTVLAKHRKFADADWAMEPEHLRRLSSLADQLTPSTPSLRYRRLFSNRELDLYEELGNYEDQRDKLNLLRQEAISQIAERGGFDAVLAFAAVVASPWQVGLAFGSTATVDVDKSVIPRLLDSEDVRLSQFLAGFVWSRFRTKGWPWVDSFTFTSWEPSQVGQFFSFLPFAPETWTRAEEALGVDASNYWKKANANPYETTTQLPFAVEQLLIHGRPASAIQCLHRMVVDKQPLAASLVAHALRELLTSGEIAKSMDIYQTVELIKVLQNDPAAAERDLFDVEWGYLQLLRQSDASPKYLERRLATEPSFFCEAIRLVYRSSKASGSEQVSSEQDKRISTNAYRLLSEWRTPPGYTGEAFDGTALYKWLSAVKEECAATGHLEVAMITVGHVLTHVPADSDGLWIDKAAAALLNAADATDMRDGFRTSLYNARGVHWVDPTGKPEKELAEKYRGRADSLEDRGFHRLATVIRELATSYDHEAERIVAHERVDG